MNPDDTRRLANVRRRVNRARNFPENTCSASRHLHLIAEQLAAGKPYPMLQEEPAHCAETMLSVLESLWKARTEVERLKRHNVGAERAAVGRPFERRVRRRWRAPTAAPGELVMRWGKLPNESPDMCMAWGEGCSKRDGALLHYMLGSKRMRWRDGVPHFDPSFLEELEARGYDLTTLRFSVRKKQAPNVLVTGDQRP